ncbi:MAG: hypothetical protein HY551_05280, partial [Elusimicrobia bacterium]|nr:hypothetical protein [Elusimicrobiota bacterium]
MDSAILLGKKMTVFREVSIMKTSGKRIFSLLLAALLALSGSPLPMAIAQEASPGSAAATPQHQLKFPVEPLDNWYDVLFLVRKDREPILGPSLLEPPFLRCHVNFCGPGKILFSNGRAPLFIWFKSETKMSDGRNVQKWLAMRSIYDLVATKMPGSWKDSIRALWATRDGGLLVFPASYRYHLESTAGNTPKIDVSLARMQMQKTGDRVEVYIANGAGQPGQKPGRGAGDQGASSGEEPASTPPPPTQAPPDNAPAAPPPSPSEISTPNQPQTPKSPTPYERVADDPELAGAFDKLGIKNKVDRAILEFLILNEDDKMKEWLKKKFPKSDNTKAAFLAAAAKASKSKKDKEALLQFLKTSTQAALAKLENSQDPQAESIALWLLKAKGTSRDEIVAANPCSESPPVGAAPVAPDVTPATKQLSVMAKHSHAGAVAEDSEAARNKADSNLRNIPSASNSAADPCANLSNALKNWEAKFANSEHRGYFTARQTEPPPAGNGKDKKKDKCDGVSQKCDEARDNT